jgi:hypothetical protein
MNPLLTPISLMKVNSEYCPTIYAQILKWSLSFRFSYDFVHASYFNRSFDWFRRRNFRTDRLPSIRFVQVMRRKPRSFPSLSSEVRHLPEPQYLEWETAPFLLTWRGDNSIPSAIAHVISVQQEDGQNFFSVSDRLPNQRLLQRNIQSIAKRVLTWRQRSAKY